MLGGRSADAVSRLASNLELAMRTFDLTDPERVAEGLEGVKVLLNCAGPFSRTAKPLVEACLRQRVHYLDITGELAVLESLAAHDAEARARGITILPGAGFDVVPSDCLAAEIKYRLPAATHLALAFQSSGGLSRGTATTMLESTRSGGFVREGGALVSVPSGQRTRRIDFGDGPRTAISIPWGDLATAYRTTGIPNIEVFVALPRLARIGVRLLRFVGPAISTAPVQRVLLGRVKAGPPGPSVEARARGETRLWAQGRDALGNVVEARLRAPDGYELSSWTAVELAHRALEGKLPPGFQTPALACGREFILEFPGVTRI